MADRTQPPIDIARQRQSEIYVGGMSGSKPAVPVNLLDLEARAREVMSPEAFAYVAGGAGSESTMGANRESFERLRIVPRMLRDVEHRDISVELFGRRLESPLLFSPIGVLEMAHADADLAVARAAAAEGVPFIFSNQASVAMEQTAAAMGDAPRWFQLYWSRSDALVESLVRRAEACGCEAIVVTLDTTLLGWRIRDLDLAYLPFLRGKGIAQYTSDPVFRRLMKEPAQSLSQERKVNLTAVRNLMELVDAYPEGFLKSLTSGEPLAAVQKFIEIYSRPSLTWDDLGLLKEITDLPVLLKGIQHPADAKRAAEHEAVDGIIVSNHGGRQVDGAIGSFDALPGCVEAVDGQIPVIFDSGIRTGADVFKALALGARAVCVGRPYVYGLAVGGEKGVREVARNFKADFSLTLGLSGARSVDEIDRASLVDASRHR